MKTSTKIVATVGIAALLATAVGCSSGQVTPEPNESAESSLVEQAKAEGAVTWYATYDPSKMEEVAKAFTAMYGIPVEVFRAPSSELIQRYSSERDAGKTVADVVTHSALEAMTDSTVAGEWVELADKGIESLTAWPEEGIFGGVAAQLNTQPFVIAYNTDLVAEADAPATWDELFTEAKPGEIARPAWDASPIYTQFLQVLRAKYGDDLLRKIGASGAVQYAGAVPISQAIAAGENTYGISFPSFVYLLKDEGAPIDYVVPTVTTGSPSYAAVPSKAPHPKAALLFMDYLLSADGQSIINTKAGVSLLPDVKGAIVAGPGFAPVDAAAASAEKDEMLTLVGAN